MSHWSETGVEQILRVRFGSLGEKAASPIAAFFNRGKIASLATLDASGISAKPDEWLRWVDPADRRLVIARASGSPWKIICWQFGISRATADRRWRYALSLLAWRLNGGAELPPRSRGRFLDTTRTASGK
jgi:hypothetical protein